MRQLLCGLLSSHSSGTSTALIGSYLAPHLLKANFSPHNLCLYPLRSMALSDFPMNGLSNGLQSCHSSVQFKRVLRFTLPRQGNMDLRSKTRQLHDGGLCTSISAHEQQNNICWSGLNKYLCSAVSCMLICVSLCSAPAEMSSF